MEKSKIQIILEALDDASAELKMVRDGLQGIEKTSKPADTGLKGVWNSLKSMKVDILAVTGTVAALGFALKKAMDLGAQGAVVIQTAESFDYLMQKTKAAPDIMRRMREEANNTVDDLTLMSSVETLVAGTTDSVAQALMNAAPDLMSYAKAANKLNPSLGTTDYMFRSIAEGVKKGQPLILDNLGLAIKLQPAYEAYAASVGKTVESLTAEEKILALLNDTKRAGSILIDQVGGTTDSATDSFNQLGAAAKNFGDYLKTKLTPAASDFARVMTRGLNDATSAMQSYDREAAILREATEAGLIGAGEAYQALYGSEAAREELLRRLNTQLTANNLAQMEAIEYAQYMNNAHAMLSGTMTELLAPLAGANEATAAYTGYQEGLVAATQSYVEAERNAVIETANLSIAMKNASGADVAKKAIEGLTTAMGLGLISEEDYRRELEEIGKNYGVVNDRSLQMSEGLALLEDAVKTGAMPMEDYSTAVDYLYKNAGNMNDASQDLIDKFVTMPEKLNYNKKVFEETEKSLREGFNVEIETARSILAEIFALEDNKDFTFTIRWVEEGTAPAGIKPNYSRSPVSETTTKQWLGGARGLDMTIPPGFPNDSFFMPLALTSGEDLSVTPKSQAGRSSGRGGGDVHIHLAYAPSISLADEYEVRDRLMPFIMDGLRKAGI